MRIQIGCNNDHTPNTGGMTRWSSLGPCMIKWDLLHNWSCPNMRFLPFQNVFGVVECNVTVKVGWDWLLIFQTDVAKVTNSPSTENSSKSKDCKCSQGSNQSSKAANIYKRKVFEKYSSNLSCYFFSLHFLQNRTSYL